MLQVHWLTDQGKVKRITENLKKKKVWVSYLLFDNLKEKMLTHLKTRTRYPNMKILSLETILEIKYFVLYHKDYEGPNF